MKVPGKTLAAGFALGAILFGGAGLAPSAYAAEPSAASEERRAPEIDLDGIARDVAARYGVAEKEVRGALDARRGIEDIYYAALLSKASGKSFAKIIGMKADWLEVERAIGVTEEQIDEAAAQLVVRDIAERSGLDEKNVAALLKRRYHPRDIRVAARLAQASGREVQTVLDMKKINQRWRDVAAELHVDMSVLRTQAQDDADEADAEEAEAAAREAAR